MLAKLVKIASNVYEYVLLADLAVAEYCFLLV